MAGEIPNPNQGNIPEWRIGSKRGVVHFEREYEDAVAGVKVLESRAASDERGRAVTRELEWE